MTEHIREEYALRKPDGELINTWSAEWFNGDAAREVMESSRDQYPDHNLTVVHRTVTFTDDMRLEDLADEIESGADPEWFAGQRVRLAEDPDGDLPGTVRQVGPDGKLLVDWDHRAAHWYRPGGIRAISKALEGS